MEQAIENALESTPQPDRSDVVKQTIKWVVYTLLIINFVFYILEDWNRAQHILTPESGLLKWSQEFATSIDEAAWFFLLFMFELETYVLDDKAWKGWVAHTVRGIRIVCYLMLAHTVFAMTDTLVDLQPTVQVDRLVGGGCDRVADLGNDTIGDQNVLRVVCHCCMNNRRLP